MNGSALLTAFEARCAERPAAIAMREASGAATTRGQLLARVHAVTRGLIRAGLTPGDHVLFAVRPGIDTIVFMLAIVEAGGVLVAADLGIGDSLFAAQMRMIQPRWVVADSLLLAASRYRLLRRLARTRGLSLLPLEQVARARCISVGPRLPGSRATITGARLEHLGRRPGVVALPTTAAEEPLIVVFTSGTTAAPKAVVHSGRSIAATLDLVGSQLCFTEGDVLYASDVHFVLPALSAGASVVIPPQGRFSAARTQRLLREHGVTHLFNVTADAQALAEHLASTCDTLPTTVRDVMIGAAPVRAGFLRRFQAVLPRGARAWCVYGMTELLPAAFITLEEKLAYEGDGDMLGTLARGVTARLTAEGELVLRGPNLFTRYLGYDSVEEHYTGDVARFENGRVVLLGRSKDMIIRGHHNIYPALHEPVVERLPGVRRCAMVGVFDERQADERVVLVVEPEDGVDGDRLRHEVGRALRSGPSRIDDAAVPDLIIAMRLPVTGRSRKVDKEALRMLARERLSC
ncbi:MAG: class I adenylate-forming enzyme family protein [Gemmatimonadaceae bacterium]